LSQGCTDRSVGVVGPVDPEQPRLALLARDVVGLVDGGHEERIPARQHRPDGQHFARGDGRGEDVVAVQRQLLRLLARQLGLGLGVEEAHLDLAPVDTPGGVGFVGGELDGPLGFVAELGVGARQRGGHADLQRLPGRPGRARRSGAQQQRRECMPELIRRAHRCLAWEHG
jgi:hypothetical protein